MPDHISESESPLELIRRFDVDFDVPARRHVALGQLMTRGAYDPPDLGAADLVVLAAYVGTSWCRMVDCDVRYDLGEGRRLLSRSRPFAERLAASLGADPASELAYVAARWFDGAAKICFRCRDLSQARLLSERAVTLAERFGLWSCRADLESNRLRMTLDEANEAGERVPPAQSQERFAKLLADLEALHAEHGVPHPDALPPAIRDLPVATREALRGMCSLLHNTAECTPGPAGLPLAERALAIATGLGDRYRESQEVHMLARAHRDEPEVAASYFRRMTELSWVRGRRIAQQQLAILSHKAGDWEQAATTLEALTEAADEEVHADAGHDLLVLAYSLGALESALSAPGAAVAAGHAERRARLRRRQITLARSTREVITIAQYKQAYSKVVAPLLRAAALDALDGTDGTRKEAERIEDAFALIEEASGRELLDLLADRPRVAPPSPAAPTPAPAHSPEPEPEPEPEPTDPGVCERRGIRRLETYQALRLAPVLERRRHDYEEDALRSPLRSTPHDPQIARKLAMLTAADPRLAVVRYLVEDDTPGDEGPLKTAGTTASAFVFRAGRISVVRGLQLGDTLSYSPPSGSAPTWAYAEALGRALLHPVWPHLQPSGVAEPPGHLVLIPSGALFGQPLHVAITPAGLPLAATLPTSFAVSATAYVGRGRHLLARQLVEHDDDLSVLIGRLGKISAHELDGLAWPRESYRIAGQAPAHAAPHIHVGPGTREGLAALCACRPEVFVFIGHGVYHRRFGLLGPALELEHEHEPAVDNDDREAAFPFLTQYDIAATVALPRNKLCVVAACVSGAGIDATGGDVSGFLRAFVAAGAGALALTLWKVYDTEMGLSVGALLRSLLDARGQTIDLPETLHRIARARVDALEDLDAKIEACPIALYT